MQLLAGCFRLRFVTGRSAFLFLLAGATLTSSAFPQRPGQTNHSERSQTERTISSPILDAMDQNTRGQSEGYPFGVPRTYAWCSGSYRPPRSSAPPADFTAVTGWGAVYPEIGAAPYANTNATIEIANAKTYVRLRFTRDWVLVQDQTTSTLTGAHFVSDFARNASREMMQIPLSNGSMIIGVPTPGYNSHFWIGRRGVYPAGSVDGVFVQMDMRTNDPDLRLVANVGADWWRDANAKFANNFSNNPGAGMSNWVKLTPEWSTLRFHSLSNTELWQSPPPPLATFAPLTGSAVIKRKANPSTPCLSQQNKQAR